MMTYPLITTLGSHVPSGSGGDVWVHLWTFDWLAEAMSAQKNPLYTTRIFYPNGVSLGTHNTAWLNFLLWLPFRQITNIWAAYSLMQITIFALNALAGYLFFRQLSYTTLLAWLGGIIIGFFPFTLSRYGQPNLALIATVPMALLFIDRMLHKQRWQDAIWAGVWVGLIGVSRWALLIVAIIPIVFFGVQSLWHHRFNRKTVIHIIIAIFFALITMMPFAWPVLNATVLNDEVDIVPGVRDDERPTKPLSWIVPNSHQTIYRPLATSISDSYQQNGNRVEFIGYTTILLTIIGIVCKTKGQRRWWAAIAIPTLMLLAIGTSSPVYRLFTSSVFGQLMRYAYRFNAVLSIPFALLAVEGASVIIKTYQKRWLVALLAVFILMESAVVPYGTRDPIMPQWLHTLEADHRSYAILQLPLNINEADKAFMMYQIMHRKKLLGGHVSRRTADMYHYQEQSAFIQWLIDPIHSITPKQIEVGKQRLIDDHVCYVVIHRFAPKAFLNLWQAALGEPYHQDDELIVYKTANHCVMEG